MKKTDTYRMPLEIEEYARKLFPGVAVSDTQVAPESIEPALQQAISSPIVQPEELEPEQDIVAEVLARPTISEPVKDAPLPIAEVQKNVEKVAQEVQPELARSPAQKVDVDELIKQQNEAEDQADLLKQVAIFRDAFISAGGTQKVETDKSVYDTLKERAKRPLKNLMLKMELEQTNAKNDPSSSVSKLARKSLVDLGMNMEGMDDVSYGQIEKMYPTLAQSLYTGISAKARVEQAKLNSELRREELGVKAEQTKANIQNQQDRIDVLREQIRQREDAVRAGLLSKEEDRELRKQLQQDKLELEKYKQQVQQERDEKKKEDRKEEKEYSRYSQAATRADRITAAMQKSTPYKLFNGAKGAQSMLAQALIDNDADKRVSAASGFFAFGKTAQGDDSVLRDSDMRVLAGQLGYSPSELLSKGENLFKGVSFTDAQLRGMMKVAKRIEEIKKAEIGRDYIQPMKAQAEKYGYDLKESISPDLLKEFEPKEPELSPMQRIELKQKQISDRLEQLRQREAELMSKKQQR
jgi:hypothetical protein